MTLSQMLEIDVLIAEGGCYAPYWGWHDDHRHLDGTPEYKPALQQVRQEYADLLDVLNRYLVSGGSCLQLGMGEKHASHEAWRARFDTVITLDWGVIAINEFREVPGFDVKSKDALDRAKKYAPYDFLFLDADHTVEGVRREYEAYAPLVRPGGIIAFHDALRRPGFEDEVQVWRYLETLYCPVYIIGAEVGFAWLISEGSLR